MESILVTGAAGFIGYHVASLLLTQGATVVGIDNLNDYGGVQLKRDRLDRLQGLPGFRFVAGDLADRASTAALFASTPVDAVVHLAAQPGVRASITHPQAAIDNNLVAFGNVLEGCRRAEIGHLVFASSSSVYGSNTQLPYSASSNVDHPISLYASTKKANELLAHSYAHLYKLPCTGLRFFTVYGPYGRTDMAPYLFTHAILNGVPINVFNNGKSARDFTYCADIADAVTRVVRKPAQPIPEWDSDRPDPASSSAPYRIYNIGRGQPVGLMRFIEVVEEVVGRKAVKNFLPAQPGDVDETWADVGPLERDFGYKPSIEIDDGVRRYVEWFRPHYGL